MVVDLRTPPSFVNDKSKCAPFPTFHQNQARHQSVWKPGKRNKLNRQEKTTHTHLWPIFRPPQGCLARVMQRLWITDYLSAVCLELWKTCFLLVIRKSRLRSRPSCTSVNPSRIPRDGGTVDLCEFFGRGSIVNWTCPLVANVRHDVRKSFSCIHVLVTKRRANQLGGRHTACPLIL